MGATPASLPAFEVAVAGRCAALAGSKNVGIHPQAHRAAGIPPLESGAAEYYVEALPLGGPFDRRRTGNDHGAHFRMYPAASDHRGGQAQVIQPRVRAGTDEDPVHRDLLDGLARLERYIRERPLVPR